MNKILASLILLISIILIVEANSDKLQIKPILTDLNEIVEDFRSRMCKEIKEFGLPKLEPLEVDKFEFDVDSDLAKVKGSISNVVVQGLSSFQLNDLKVNAISLQLLFTFILPKVRVRGNFNIKGLLGGLLPVEGEGRFDITLVDFRIEKFKGRIRNKVGTLQLTEMSAKPKLGKNLEVELDKIVPSQDVHDFILKVLRENVPELLDALWEDYENDIFMQIEELSKTLLKDVEIKDIVAIVLGTKKIFDTPSPNCDPVILP